MTSHHPPSPLRIDQTSSPERTTLALDGVLDGTTYRTVRDAVVKAALDAPPMVIVDVTALWAPAPSAWSVFTSARWLVLDWPDVPIGLVCSHAAGRRALARNGIARYLPVYASAGSATDALATHARPTRLRARQKWDAAPSAVVGARNFVSQRLEAWEQGDWAVTAGVITTILVRNVLRHTRSDPDVRVETDGATVTVAVTDGSSRPACVLDEGEVRGAMSELHVVESLTRLWGNTPVQDGKVVWAVIGPENRL